MASGLPIIFSGEGEGKKIVETNNIGWTSDALDYEKLKSNIQIAAQSPELLKEKSNNCIACANEKFNRPKQIKALYEYIKCYK